MGLIGVEACQRVCRLAASDSKNRRNFNVAKSSSQPTRGVRLVRGFVLLVADRQFPEGVDDKALQLILKRERVFFRQEKGILRLLVEVGSVINRSGKRVTCREGQFVVHSSIQREGNTPVGGSRGI